jgi:hypothetical protein
MHLAGGDGADGRAGAGDHRADDARPRIMISVTDVSSSGQADRASRSTSAGCVS